MHENDRIPCLGATERRVDIIPQDNRIDKIDFSQQFHQKLDILFLLQRTAFVLRAGNLLTLADFNGRAMQGVGLVSGLTADRVAKSLASDEKGREAYMELELF